MGAEAKRRGTTHSLLLTSDFGPPGLEPRTSRRSLAEPAGTLFLTPRALVDAARNDAAAFIMATDLLEGTTQIIH